MNNVARLYCVRLNGYGTEAVGGMSLDTLDNDMVLSNPVVVYFLYVTLRSFAFQIYMYFAFAVFVYCFGKLIINYVVGPVCHVLRNEC